MAISLKHNFASGIADEGDTSLVRPSNWNAEHDLTLATSRLVGRTTAGTGSAEEISVGAGLSLNSGSLAVSSTTPQVNTINTFTVAQVIDVTDNSNPALRITQTGTADALRIEDEASPDSTPFVITAAGHAIAGYGSTLTLETVVPQFQSHTATLDEGGFGGVDWGNTSTGQVSWFGKSRGGSYGTQAILSSGDTIGDFRFYGSDGVGLIPAAKIEVEVDGTPGVNDMPGRIGFFTTADGAASPTERIRIRSDGNIGIGDAGDDRAIINIAKSIGKSGFTTGQAIRVTGEILPTTTAFAQSFYSQPSTASNGGVPYTLGAIQHFAAIQGTINADSTITEQRGFTANQTLIGATTNTGFFAANTAAVTAGKTAYGFYSGVNTASGGGTTYGFYAGGTSVNVMPNLSGGIAASSTLTLQSTTAAGTTDAILFRTGTQSERFRIATAGQLGIGGANYGTSGQVLTSGGASAAPSWTTPTASAASGMFWENDLTLTTNYTITTGKNAGTFGPVTINAGVTVTVPSTSTWTIV